MSKSCVVILDPRGAIYGGGRDVIFRHATYAQYLSKNIDFTNLFLIICTAGKDKKSIFLKNNFNIEIISEPTFNSIKFAKRAANFATSKDLSIKLLIVGDPWESFWSAYFFNKFYHKNVPIQIQLHGDIANPVWKRINIKNRARFNLAKLSLGKASGIRAVSNNQALKVAKIFKIKKTAISVIPVPITNLELKSNVASKRPVTLGFVGRIHVDRGIYNFVQLIKSLAIVRDDFTVLIAGGGPAESRFLEEIKQLLPNSKIRFLGHLSEKELKKVWREIGILVSTAPAESYGRSMRQALVAGVPIWATNSSGVEDLISRFGKNAVRVLDLTKSHYELSLELDQLIKSKVSQKFRKQFIKDNATYAELLAKSWIDLINQQK